MEARVVVGATHPTERVPALGADDVGAPLHKLEHGPTLRAVVYLHLIHDETVFLFSLSTSELIMPAALARGAEVDAAARTCDMPLRFLPDVEDLLAPSGGAEEKILVPHHPPVCLELLVLGVAVL